MTITGRNATVYFGGQEVGTVKSWSMPSIDLESLLPDPPTGNQAGDVSLWFSMEEFGDKKGVAYADEKCRERLGHAMAGAFPVDSVFSVKLERKIWRQDQDGQRGFYISYRCRLTIVPAERFRYSEVDSGQATAFARQLSKWELRAIALVRFAKSWLRFAEVKLAAVKRLADALTVEADCSDPATDQAAGETLEERLAEGREYWRNAWRHLKGLFRGR